MKSKNSNSPPRQFVPVAADGGCGLAALRSLHSVLEHGRNAGPRARGTEGSGQRPGEAKAQIDVWAAGLDAAADRRTAAAYNVAPATAANHPVRAGIRP